MNWHKETLLILRKRAGKKIREIRYSSSDDFSLFELKKIARIGSLKSKMSKKIKEKFIFRGSVIKKC